MKDDLEKSLSHDRLADRFDDLMNEYDLTRRLETLIDDFLGQVELSGLGVLDAGCGTGRASRVLKDRGAHIIPIDIGAHLVARTRQRCGNCAGTVASILQIPFPNDAFDVVFSTEVIEHTRTPIDTIAEFQRVLKPGGYLVLSTPNKAWHWLVMLASMLRVRPYEGFENFVSPGELRRAVQAQRLQILRHTGIHLLPFQIKLLQPVLRRLDRWGDSLLPVMINQCLLATKTTQPHQ